MNDWREEERLVALPALAFTSQSLQEAAGCLLDYMARLLPEVVNGVMALAEYPTSALRPTAAVARRDCTEDICLTPFETETLSLEDNALLCRVFLEGSEIRLSHANGHESRTLMAVERGTTLVLPLMAFGDRVGALLLRYAGSLSETSCDLLRRTALAAATRLHDLQREVLFRELERSKRHWEAAFDSLQDLLYIHDANGNLLKVNRSLAERLTLTARELMLSSDGFAKHFPIHCDPAPITCSSWRNPVLEGEFEMTRTPVMDKQDNLVGCIHILRDITERVRLEAQVRQSEKMAMMGEMVSGVAHELNNPLASIVGYASRLSKKESQGSLTRETRADYVRKIGLEAARAARIVGDLLTFARPQALDLVPLDLNEVILKIQDLCAESLQAGQVELRLALCEGLPEVLGNEHSLHQVMDNLIRNSFQAIRAVKDRGSIVIRTQYLETGKVRLTVQDNGPGIRPEHQERVFDPFFTTKRVGEGTGLGLALCYSILGAHGASIDIESEVGKGAAFHIEFTAIEARRAPGGEADREFSPSVFPVIQERGGALRIAVLDDEPIIRELLQEMLEEYHHQVTCFGTPHSALEALETHSFDIILSDIKMPGMNGMAFYEAVRTRHREQAERILFLTGDVLAPDTRMFFERTGSPHLNKPFLEEALMEQIAALRKRLEQSAAVREDAA